MEQYKEFGRQYREIYTALFSLKHNCISNREYDIINVILVRKG